MNSSYNSLILNLRGNYVTQDKKDLHELANSKIVNELAIAYHYYNHVFCNVCDTCVFFKIDNDFNREFVINYHRGTMTTSIKFGDVIEVNDLILLQDGSFCYDWDLKKENIESLLKMLNIENKEAN